MNEEESSHPYVMIIDKATIEQCFDIGKYCGSIGVTGVFKRGTLEEIYEKEIVNRRSSEF